MEKLKIAYKKIREQFSGIAAQYPATLGLIILTSIAAAVFIDQSGTPGQFMENKGIPFLILWGFGTFCAETWFREKKPAKWAGSLAAGLTAFLLIHICNSGTELSMEKASHWRMAYALIMITMGVYGNYKRSALAFNEFCIRVIHKLSRLAIISAVTGIGIALVMAVFVTLILNGEHFMLLLRAEFLVLGVLVGSGLLNAQLSLDRELPRFFTVIVKYLLPILLLAAFAIIYGYILKIIITQVVPSNEIFRILAALFIIGLPIWTMAGTFEQDHPLVRITGMLPYIFIPFLFLQGYAIRERILQFGITPFRYLCLALMAFEIIYIIVYTLKKRETAVMLPLFAVMAAVSLVLPYVNMYSTAVRSQKGIFDRFISSDFHALSSDDQSSLAGAYYYLTGSAEGKAALSNASPEKIAAIKESGKTGDPEIDRNLYIYDEFPITDMDISAFGQMTLLSTFSPLVEKENEAFDPERITFYGPSGEKQLEADISAFLTSCISAYAENRSGTPDIPALIPLPDGSSLRIWHCSMTVGPENEISFLDLNAVWLK